MELITSLRNPKIREARALKRSKARAETGLFLVEGIRHVGTALEANAPIETIFYAPDLLTSDFSYQVVEKAQEKRISCFATTPEIFQSLAEKSGPQGLLAVVRQNPKRLDSLYPQDLPWAVAVVTPQDPGNIGTILRTADAAGANGLILLDGGADPWHPTAVRASMGALFWLPVTQTSFQAFQSWAQTRGYAVYGTSAHGAVDYRNVTYQSPAVLLLGSEREGLTSDQAAACQALVRMPMIGHSTSLNLAVAAGIMLYAMQSQIIK